MIPPVIGRWAIVLICSFPAACAQENDKSPNPESEINLYSCCAFFSGFKPTWQERLEIDTLLALVAAQEGYDKGSLDASLHRLSDDPDKSRYALVLYRKPPTREIVIYAVGASIPESVSAVFLTGIANNEYNFGSVVTSDFDGDTRADVSYCWWSEEPEPGQALPSAWTAVVGIG